MVNFVEWQELVQENKETGCRMFDFKMSLNGVEIHKVML